MKILLIVCCIIILYYIIKTKENFVSIDYSKKSNKFGDPLSTSYQYRTIEEQFPDVIAYDNDTETLRMGLDKCAEQCIPKGGTCVEFGVTGNAWCYPKTTNKQKETVDIQNNSVYTYANM